MSEPRPASIHSAHTGPLRLAIAGANGRMGRHLCELVEQAADLLLVARVVEPGQPGGVELSGLSAESLDLLVDFTVPGATAEVAQWCRRQGVPWVLGTTGLGPREQDQVEATAQQVAVFQATNFSIGVALLADLTARAAAVLGLEADIEIVEAHHRHKRDAPSGTALTLARAAATARGQRLEDARRDGRSGLGDERPVGEIGIHAVRMADIVGEHEVSFGWPAERLSLRHEARDRRVFAHGALRAARWLAQRAPGTGLYGMSDLLRT